MYDFRTLNDVLDTEEKKNEFVEYMMNVPEENTLRYPIVVITCKNRKNSILKNLDKFLDTKIYVYIYETEMDLYSWLSDEKVTKVYVPEEYRSVQKMRKYVQSTMKEPIFHFLDDDLKSFYFYRRNNLISAAHALKIAEMLIHDEDWAFIGYQHINMSCHFRTKDIRIANPICYIIINNKKLKENDVYYTGNTNVNEDDEICINAAKKGLYQYIFNFQHPFNYYKIGSNKSTASTIEQSFNYIFNNYLTFGNFRNPWVSKHGIILQKNIIEKILKKEVVQQWDQDIVEACKSHDLKRVYKILIEKGLCYYKWREVEFPYEYLDDIKFLEYCYYNHGDPLKYKQ